MNENTPLPIIAIDGPAGSGKSTIAKMVAKALQWTHVSTGSLYRAFALLFCEQFPSISCQEETKFLEKQDKLKEIGILLQSEFYQEPLSELIFLGKRDITTDLTSSRISEWSSVLAQHEQVRKIMLPIQKKVVLSTKGAVVDGRDIGTVVFPDAALKVFLTASLQARALRRFNELKNQSEAPCSLSLEDLIQTIQDRDLRDTERAIAPLKQAEDALLIDSTSLSLQDVTQIILNTAAERKLPPGKAYLEGL